MAGNTLPPQGEPGPAAPPLAPAAARPPPRKALRWIVGAVALLAVLAGLAFAVLAWSVRTPSGSAWLVSLLPGVQVTAPRGTLLGDFAAERVDIDLGGLGTLRLEAPAWRGLSLGRGDHGRWATVTVVSLHADRVTLLPPRTPAPASPPGAPPASLRLPIELVVGSATVGELRLGGPEATPVRDLRARVHLGADGGALHRLEELGAAYAQAAATGTATIGADAPLPVVARVDVAAPESAPPLQASLVASGDLAALRIAATARVPATATRPAQSLDLSALVRPFAAWPLGELRAKTETLDLSALMPGLPATALSGQAVVQSEATDRPAVVSLDLRNARAGRWNEGLLPLHALRAELRARPDRPGVLTVQSFTAALGSAARPAGDVTGSGGWNDGDGSLALTFDRVQAQRLDARAPDTALGGTVSLSASGLAGPPAGRRVVATGTLSGQLPDPALPRGAPRDARVAFEVDATPLRIALRRADATLGDASAKLAATLTRATAEAPWRAAGTLVVARFDPAPWWPGATPSKARSRIDARAAFDLTLPGSSAGDDVYALVAATRGTASVSIDPSRLEGVEIAGSARFAHADGPAEAALQLAAAGNRVSAEGRVAAQGGRDDWRIAIDAPQLAGLAPLVGRFSGAASPTLAGSLVARAHVAGRWPDIRSDGELQASDLRYGTLAARHAAGRWQLGSAAEAPLDATLSLDGVSDAGRAVDQVRAHVSGTARAHRVALRIESQALPPEWIDALAGRAAAAAAPPGREAASAAAALASSPAAGAQASAAGTTGRSALVLSAEGGLVESGGVPAAGWKGRIGELVAQGTAAPARTWVRASDVRGSVFWAGGPLRLDVEPGSLQALGATMRWSRLSYRGATAPGAASGGRAPAAAPAQVEIQATVDPFPVAPILDRLQPDFGWTGDLAVGARIDVRSRPAIEADVVIERARGDLGVRNESLTTPLGLTDLRLGMAGRDGVYSFTVGLAGSTMGVASGAVTARTGNATAWPDARTPIEGVLELRVADLGSWGTWLPAAWRLGGQLHASAAIAGRLGAPEITGHLEGSQLSARNFLEGVNVTGGELAVALQGETARLERFTARGGEGSIDISGTATLGAAPTARLAVVADRFQLLGRVDRRIVASGNGRILLDARTVSVAGAFKVDQGLIDFTRSDAPQLGDDVVVVRRPGNAPAPTMVPPATTPPPASAAARALDLDLRVDLGESLRIRGRGIDAGLRGELHLTSPAGRLAVAGSVRAVDGTYQAYGQKLTIDRSVITFVGPIENPRLDIEATRPDLDVRVGVIVSGTALNPRVRLFSEPELSDVDKLSWLVLGKASTATGGTETALLQRAALALLSGEGPGTTDKVTRALGLDAFSVRTGEGGVRDTIVSVGKQISKRWYVGYERGLNATTGSWQLIYRIAQRLTVKAQAGGDNAIDLNWTLRWK